MSRLSRIHVDGGLYYVEHRSGSGRSLFERSADYAHFEEILSKALDRFDVRAHAYCWQPHSIHLAVQIKTIPLHRFMQSVGSCYARRLKSQSATLFEGRYSALLVDPKYLLQLIRYIHYLPSVSGVILPRKDFPWSSHWAYLEQTPLPWLTKNVALQKLSYQTKAVSALYVEFMAERGADHPKRFVERGCKDPRIVGDQFFVSSLSRNLPINRTIQTLHDIIQAVMQQQGISQKELDDTDDTDGTDGKDGLKAAVLARALVMYHATQRHVASCTEVSKALHRSVATLQAGIRRYRNSSETAHLFDLSKLRGGGSIFKSTIASSSEL